MHSDTPATTLLEAQGLSISLRHAPHTPLVKNMSFSMGRERLALVGESGSGKSLTAKTLMGLLPSSCQFQARQLSLQGQDLRQLTESQWSKLRGSTVTMVLQDPKYALNPVLNIGEQVAEPLLLHTRLGKKERRDKVLHMLDAVGLPNPNKLQQTYPHQLSGGMGQRVMLAMALITEPTLLIADEPTSALDHQMREQALQLMIRLVEERQMGLLLISHDLQQVSHYCDRAMVMYQGELVDTLPANELARASHPYTRTLWSCRPNKATHGQRLPVFDRQTAGAR